MLSYFYLFLFTVFQLQGGINVFTQGSGTPPPSYIPPPTAMPTTTSNSLSNYPISSQPQLQQQRQSPAYPVQVPSKMGGLTPGTTGLNPYPTLPSTSTSSTYSNIKSGKQNDTNLNSHSTSPVSFTSQPQSLGQGVSQSNQIASSSLIAASNYQNVPSYQPSYDCPATSHQFHPNLNSNTNSTSNTNGNGKEYQYQNNTDFGSKNPSPNNAYNHSSLPLPDIPTEFREIRNLTTFQLEKLSKDEVAIQVNKKKLSADR